jgi:PAS domain S-box-containing protein
MPDREERFHTMAETAKDAIIMMDNEGKISYWNPAAEKIFGYTNQEVFGEELRIIIPEKYHKDYHRGIGAFKETGQGPAVGKKRVSEAIRKNGTVFPVEIFVSAVQIMGEWFALGIVRDISERKLMEETLKEIGEKYKLLFNIEKDAIMFVDSETQEFLEINKVAEELYGYSRDEFLKMRATDVSAYPEEIDVGITQVGDLAADETLNSMHKKKDGTVFPVEISGTAFLWKNRKTFCTKVRDVTEPEEK